MLTLLIVHVDGSPTSPRRKLADVDVDVDVHVHVHVYVDVHVDVHQPLLPGRLLVRGTEPIKDRTTVEGEDNLRKKRKILIYLFIHKCSKPFYRVHKMAEYGDVVDPFHLVNH